MALASTPPSPYAMDWRSPLCRRLAAYAYTLRFSFGGRGGEKQLNFLPFEMCAASEKEAGKTKPSETLHTIGRMPSAEGDAGRHCRLVTHCYYACVSGTIPDLIVGHSFTGASFRRDACLRAQKNICRITVASESESIHPRSFPSSNYSNALRMTDCTVYPPLPLSLPGCGSCTSDILDLKHVSRIFRHCNNPSAHLLSHFQDSI